MNVLLTAAGDAVAITRAFVAATACRGGRVIVADAEPATAPAASAAADAVALDLRGSDAQDRLRSVIERFEIALVVPLGDDGLLELASAAPSFEAHGCAVAVGTSDFVSLAADKLATVEWCRRNHVDVPATWSGGELDPATLRGLPAELFVRPRRGSGSHGARVVSHRELEALLATRDPGGLVVQERVRRAEVTIDALFDLDGRLINAVPRLRLAVAAGRSTRSVTIADDSVTEWAVRVLRRLGDEGASGLVSVQAFVGRGSPSMVEINARAGAGLPLTIAAGADHASWLLAAIAGERPAPAMGCHRADVMMAAYPEFVITEQRG